MLLRRVHAIGDTARVAAGLRLIRGPLCSNVHLNAQDGLQRESLTSVDDLEQAIAQYIERHNENPKPFIWTANADDILTKVTRAKAALARVGR